MFTEAATLDAKAIHDHRNELASLHGELNIDARLSKEGREARFAEAAAQIAARNSQLVRQIREAAENSIDVLQSAINNVLTDPVPGAEGILGRQAQWARAKEMMAADIPLRKIIDEATQPEILNAIFDEYPTWARINFKNASTDQAEQAADLYALRIERRFAEIAGRTRAGADARIALATKPDSIALPILLTAATTAAAATDPAMAADLRSALEARAVKQRIAAALHVAAEGQLRPSQRHGV